MKSKINEQEKKKFAFTASGGTGAGIVPLPDRSEQDSSDAPPKTKIYKMKGSSTLAIVPLPEVMPLESPDVSATPSDKKDKKCAVDARYQKTCSDNNLSKFCGGQNVKDAQNKLIQKGFKLPRFGADCRFGNETRQAVKNFQRANELPVTGIIDQATHDALFLETTSESKINRSLKIMTERNEKLEKLIFEKLVK